MTKMEISEGIQVTPDTTEAVEFVAPAISVENVDEGEFFRTIGQIETQGNFQKVGVSDWIETNLTTAVENLGAAPCVQIYAVAPEKGVLLSGHFPETQDDPYNSPALLGSVEKYRNMMRRVGELSESDEEVEIHLFGQAGAGTAQELAKRKAIIDQLRDAGVHESRVYDQRIQDYNRADSTVYIPGRGIILKRT